MSPGKRLLSFAIPATLVICGALHASAISALVEATAVAAPALALPPPPMTLAESAPRPPLDRIFGQSMAGTTVTPSAAPIDCTGIRALVVVRAEDQDASLVALEVGGTRMLRRKGMSAGDMTVAWVGPDRAWLSRGAETCEAKVFGAAAPNVHPEPKKPVPVQGVVRVSPNEVQIDRATLDKYLENPAELSKVRVLPDATGIRIQKVPPNSVLAVLGIEEGDMLKSAGGIELTSPEKIMELYARLRTFEKMSMVVERKGKPMTMDYVVR